MVFNAENIHDASMYLACGDDNNQISELVILSTCNRIELYAVSNCFVPDALESFLVDVRGVAAHLFRPHLYHYTDKQAVSHLLQVASGLDSLVLGEPQILGQVADALELARQTSSIGPILSRLFQRAIHAGKRARTETYIARNPASISSLAASMAEASIHNLSQAQIVILGAGEMAELAVEALRKRGAVKVLVLNRTIERAEILAKRWQATASTFEYMNEALSTADILISSTGAPHTILHPGTLKDILEQRPARPLVMIDIAVPRDIDPGCGEIPGVVLYDMDSLQAHLKHSLSEREAEVPRVKAILTKEAEKFLDFFHSLDMLPLIAEVRQHAEVIRQTELDKTLRHLPGLSEAEKARIEAMTSALVKKLLDTPTNRMRAEANTPTASEYASMVRTLFGLTTVD
ncbi:MAG: glutamyl-tRNA reductase [Chloroflexi bacterium GWB2_49_20]|nr:MAG: glutamyl-tRNA reductase [Chloroflexi bacterium GWB2_49_20]OGN77973.1 MAG: glutamyl-tRNA reductase [Chloroflexi bacterium GWC2_49_37]OGN85011.1 MAG: glutamyl-tRNA reductase [Chloroflexi bacterium GWD2_49_16]